MKLKQVKQNGAVKNAKTQKAVKAQIAQSVAIIIGARGLAARLVETHKTADGLKIRALQNNIGLPLKAGQFADVKDGTVTGKRPALIELGCYANGKTSGAKIVTMTQAQFLAKAHPCIVHWKADDNGIHGHYIGNPNVKGMVAVAVAYSGKLFFWQMEMDSNANNKHERGTVKSIKPEGKLVEVKV
jgi:hypothetical protein